MNPIMTPKSVSGRETGAPVRGHHILRVIATVSAAIGFFLNIITIVTITRTHRYRSAVAITGWAFLPVSSIY